MGEAPGRAVDCCQEGRTPLTTVEAYAFCRGVARREAKNFYWAFRVLPRHKSDGMCAVYAFMRKADDLADDELKSVEERRVLMAEWLNRWRHAGAEGVPAGPADPVFLALKDTQRRFGISDDLLEQLVRGTTMDLEPQRPALDGMQTYATFAELYGYCYLVASVVGLVCIRIFGYRDRRAEELAEKTGVAFQLTNVLRDVKEDVERGRLYLPLETLAGFGVTTGRIRELASGASMSFHDRCMLASMRHQAQTYYESADALIPLLDRDSRAAMWVLARIYRRLLERIGKRGDNVFLDRVSVPAREKLWIMARGAGMALWNRVRA